MNEWKATKVNVYVQCFSPSFQAWEDVLKFDTTPWIVTVIIEVSTVQALRSRANPQRLHGAIHLPSMNWTYGDTGFYSAQTSYLDMKVLTFAKDKNNYAIFFKPLLTWVMIKMLTLQWPR